jgi:peroxiredoxin
MHTRSLFLSLATALLLVLPGTTRAESAEVGKAAPNFTLVDSNGAKHSLSDYKGKIVVLEWFNPDCPFVKKHYAPGNMQKLQKQVVDGGGVWFSINSSAAGKQGHLSGDVAKDAVTKYQLASTALLLDHDGVAGKAYGAKTTPHMFVIDSAGTLAYAGALDDTPSTDSADIATAKNHVRDAVEALKAGKAVEPAVTDPYGCGVKYKS